MQNRVVKGIRDRSQSLALAEFHVPPCGVTAVRGDDVLLARRAPALIVDDVEATRTDCARGSARVRERHQEAGEAGVGT